MVQKDELIWIFFQLEYIIISQLNNASLSV